MRHRLRRRGRGASPHEIPRRDLTLNGQSGNQTPSQFREQSEQQDNAKRKDHLSDLDPDVERHQPRYKL